MTRLHMVLLILMCIGANVLQSGAETLLATEGDLVTLRCSLSGAFEYPAWLGPPSLFIYTVQDSPDINPVVNASERLSYSDNKKDLLLTNAVVADSGEYKCSYVGFGVYTFNLNVSEKTSAETTTDCGLKVFHNCKVSEVEGVVAWVCISIAIVALVTVPTILILHFVFEIKFPFRILNSKNKRTSPNCTDTGSKTGKPQQPNDEVNQDLVMQDNKRIDKGSADHTKTRPPAKLDQLNEPGSEKHHFGGRPLPKIGKYN